MALLPTSLAIRPYCCFCGARAFDSSKAMVAANFVCGTKLSRGFGRMDTEEKTLLVGDVNQCVVRDPCLSLGSRVSAVTRSSLQQTEQVATTSTEIDELKSVSTYLFRMEIGGHVKVLVRKKNAKYIAYVEVSSLELVSGNTRLMLSWGIYRSDSACFMLLDSQSSSPDARTIDISFIQRSFDRFELELEFEAKQTPFYLSFVLKSMLDSGLSALEIRSHRKEKFCVPIGFDRGSPAPLGLSFSNDGSMNFAFFSRTAEKVVLCLYDDTKTNSPALELDLDPYVNRTGDVWHTSLEGAWSFSSYGYRCRKATLQGDAYDEAKHVLLDPYAKIISMFTANHGPSLLPKYLGRLSKEPAFDWTGDVCPGLAMEKLVVYRLNVKRFTEHNSSQLSTDVAGTFTGLAEKVNHFKNLGVNAVLIEPIFPFDEQLGPYFPCHFFSPSNLFGRSGGSISAISSMKDMVKRLHASGIEVLLEVVFTHTSKGGSLQGIDDFCYYYENRNPDLESINALNCNFPVVQRMILDSLHHWVTEFHIDGLCFINASALLRGFDGEYLSRPPLVEAIAFDPLLSKTKIIADCWDPQNMKSEEVLFPHWKRWAEINSKFCCDVRNFMRGDGPLSNLATRLCGSGDIFSSGRGPAFSFNYIARNFGLPLVDLVSFSGGKLASELSWNCGEQGPTNKTPVLERRLKQIRNYIFILFVSFGVPVLNMGDECGQSSGGSISYNSRKPFDWDALSTGFGTQTTQFISFLCSLRTRRSDLLQKRNFLKEENIDWHGTNQSPPRWDDPTCKFLAMMLKAEKADSELESETSDVRGDLYMAFNAAGSSESVVLPLVPDGFAWRRLVDTALPFPGFFVDGGEPVPEQMSGLVAYEMKPYSCTLFEARSQGG